MKVGSITLSIMHQSLEMVEDMFQDRLEETPRHHRIPHRSHRVRGNS